MSENVAQPGKVKKSAENGAQVNTHSDPSRPTVECDVCGKAVERRDEWQVEFGERGHSWCVSPGGAGFPRRIPARVRAGTLPDPEW